MGCLAAYSSGRALLNRLDSRGIGSLDELVAAALDGDTEVAAELGAAAEILGTALATTVTTINPDRLVLGGPLGVIPVVVERVRQRISIDVDERAWPRVEASTLGGRATGRGLARLVVRRAFAATAVDAALAAAAGSFSRSSSAPLVQVGQERDRCDLLRGELCPTDAADRAGPPAGPAVQHPLRSDDQIDGDVVGRGRDRSGRA